MVLELAVVVEEADAAHPGGGHQHQDHVDVGQVAEQQAWDEDAEYYDEAAHGGGADLFHLPFEAEVAHHLADLHSLQAPDDAVAEDQGDEQGHGQRHAGAERHVVHEPQAGEVEIGRQVFE